MIEFAPRPDSADLVLSGRMKPPPCQNISHAGARRQEEKPMPMFTLVTDPGANTAATYDHNGSLLDYGHVDDVTERLLDRIKETLPGLLDVRPDQRTMPEGESAWGQTFESLDRLQMHHDQRTR